MGKIKLKAIIEIDLPEDCGLSKELGIPLFKMNIDSSIKQLLKFSNLKDTTKYTIIWEED